MNNQWLIILAAAAVVVLGTMLFLMHNNANRAIDGDGAYGSTESTDAGAVGEASSTTIENVPPTPTEEPTQARPTEDLGETRVAVVETNMGTFKVALYLELTPITAGNFVKLVEQKFYDGLIFHRVIDGFVIQGGDPYCVSKEGPCGTGGPGWSIDLEIVKQLRHNQAGMLAMARSQDPNSAGSQFYITLTPAEFLDDGYAVFGKVIEGLDVVLAIGKVATNDEDRPMEDVVTTRIYMEDAK